MKAERKRPVRTSIAALVLTLSVTAATATDRHVPADYATIQAAINAADPGDAIDVAAGTYPEALVVDKAVAIWGEGREQTTIDATGATADAAININGPGGSVTIDGLTIRSKNSTSETFGINVVSGAAGSTVTITNCRVQGTNDPNAVDYGVYVHGTTASFVFQQNIVTGTSFNPLMVEENPGATDVSHNAFDAGPWGSGCFYMTYGGTDVTSLQRFSYNTFDLGTGEAFDYDHRVEALSITGALWGSLGPGGYSNVEIRGNYIYNGHAYGRGIGLWNDDAGDGSGGVIANAVIEGNRIEGLNPANEGSCGLRLAGNLVGITIGTNLITGMETGILGRDGYYAMHYPGLVNAQQNSIAGNGTGVAWPTEAVTLEATGNWWGDASGPHDPIGTIEAPPCSSVATDLNADGAGNAVSENVLYCPWLLSSAPTLTLAPDGTCYHVGQEMHVDVVLSDATSEIVGGQYWIEYDPAKLSYLSCEAAAPWPTLIYMSHSAPIVFLSVGMAEGGTGAASGTMARLRFLSTAGDCNALEAVRFKSPDGAPPTRLTDRFDQAVYPTKVDLNPIVIDSMLPTVTCPDGIDATADVGVCHATGVVLGTPAADDNCGVNDMANDAPAEFPVGTTTVTWTVTDCAGNESSCTQTVIVADDEPPTITCPEDIDATADNGVCYATGVALGTPTTGDNCGVAGVINDAPVRFPVGTTTVTWTVTDIHGNTATCMQTVTVVDSEDPVITCPGNISTAADAGGCYASGVVLGTPATGDNCGVAGVINDAPDQFPVGETTVTWTVTDVHGRTDTCEQSVTVNDAENPAITGCPEDIIVSADAGLCTAAVSWTEPTAADNCGIASFVRSHAPGSTFDAGTTPVTYTATDIHGNVQTCSFNVTVDAVNDLTVSLRLLGASESQPFDRCIRFELYGDCDVLPAVVQQVVHFESGLASNVGIPDLDCGAYTCIRAKDPLHTLWSSVPLALDIDGTGYVADFTATDDALVLGNLNNDEWIDVLDFGTYVTRFGQTVDLDTTCSTLRPHPNMVDIGLTANLVDSADFDPIAFYFLVGDDPSCCGGKDGGRSGPITSIAVADLAKYGLEELAPADLNGDRYIDLLDIMAFANGQLPEPPAPPAPSPDPGGAHPLPPDHNPGGTTPAVPAPPPTKPEKPGLKEPTGAKPGRG